MKASMIILVLTIIACAVISADACPKSKYFKGTCNALTRDCQIHCTRLEGAKSGQCVYKFPSFRCTCCY
ncbi:unnamed protein product [Arctia plantaginis]|uniref:Defensin n=1 Tax=Arctia plantaginis TaxID=874455 RepID=A0A8S0YLJ4_ARCPL|nr:unnamed protein product [Arctia plantaginis]